jgi:hypothetical protein
MDCRSRPDHHLIRTKPPPALFRNVHEDCSQEDGLIHAGLPVTQGVKWIASRWIRAADFLE